MGKTAYEESLEEITSEGQRFQDIKKEKASQWEDMIAFFLVTYLGMSLQDLIEHVEQLEMTCHKFDKTEWLIGGRESIKKLLGQYDEQMEFTWDIVRLEQRCRGLSVNIDDISIALDDFSI